MKGRLLGLAVLATATMVHAADQLAKLNAGNTVIAEEYLGSQGSITTNLTNAYQVFQPIAAGNRIKLTVTNAKFSLGNATKITLCKGSEAVTETSTTVSINTDKTVAILKIKKPIGNGEVYYFVRGNSTACDPTKVSNYIQYSLPALKEGDTVVLSITGLDQAANIADASAPVATIKKQFSVELKETSAKINLTTFKTFVPEGSLVDSTIILAKFKIKSDENIPSINRVTVTGGDNVCDGQLPQGWTVDFTLKGTLQEYSFIAINNYKQPITNNDRINGQVTISGFDLNANPIVCKTNTKNPGYSYIKLKVDGQTPIQQDTKKLSIKLKYNPNYTSDLITDANAFIIKLNATTLYVPLVGVSSDGKRETYIKLQMSNNTLKSTNVTFFILADDGSIVATYNKTLTAGNVLQITGSELKDAAIKQGKTISGDSFAVKIIITAPVSDIFAYATMVDPSGPKRVPVKVLYKTDIDKIRIVE